MTDYDAIRVVYKPVTDDLPNGSKHLGDEQSEHLTEFEFERHDGEIVRVRGETDDGRDVISPTPDSHKSTVRGRDADKGTFSLSLGWVQRIEGVENMEAEA